MLLSKILQGRPVSPTEPYPMSSTAAECQCRKIRLVWQAAEKLGYKVNAKAQSLRLGKDRAIAVMLPGIEYTHWAAMYEVFQSEFSQRGYSVQLYSTRSMESRELSLLTEALNAVSVRSLPVPA